MTRKDPVVDAVDGWRKVGWIDEALHTRLRADAEESAELRRRQFAGQFITGAGGALLIVALVVLTTIFWEDLTPLTRAGFLWAATALVFVLGRLRLSNAATDRMGTALVLVALPLAMFATGLTKTWRENASDVWVAGGIVATGLMIGFSALRDVRKNPVLPAAATAAALIFTPIAAALLGVDDMDPLWVAMDVVVFAGLAVLAASLILGWGDRVLAAGAREGILGVAFVAAIPLVPLTWFDVLNRSTDGFPIFTLALLAVGGVALGMWTTRTSMVMLGSLVGVGDAWYFGITQGQAFGTFFALFVSALVLFWLGGRLGIGRKGTQAAAAAGAPDAARTGTQAEADSMPRGSEPGPAGPTDLQPPRP